MEEMPQVIQGVFFVNHEIAKRYHEIANKYEQQTDADARKKCNDEYLALKDEVKSSQENIALEWIVERNDSGEPKWWNLGSICAEQGQLGWLGNMTPAEEYYYLQAAIVVRGED